MNKKCNLCGSFRAKKTTTDMLRDGPTERRSNERKLLINMRKQSVLCSVYYIFELPHRKIKFFCKAFIRDSVNQTPFKQFPVTF